MVVYRISRRVYSKELSGIGAGLYGGRWNPKGVNLLYTAEHISLACMEYLVHNIHVMIGADICLTKIRIPDSASPLTLNAHSLPPDWMEKSYIPDSTQNVGLDFVNTGEYYLLKIPSIIVPDEFNYLLNPLHPDHSKTHIEEVIDPFIMDERLFG